MASARQTAANRANSKKSTGPRSVKGKAVARHNALKHGLTAGAASAIVGEDVRDLEEFTANIIGELNPISQLEHALSERIAIILWRLKRVPVFEAAIVTAREAATAEKSPDRRDEKRQALLDEKVKRYLMAKPSDESADRDAPSTTDEQEHRENAEDEPVDSTEAVGRALIHDSENSDALGKILRYETALNNTLARTMAMLMTLQSTREGREKTAKNLPKLISE